MTPTKTLTIDQFRRNYTPYGGWETEGHFLLEYTHYLATVPGLARDRYLQKLATTDTQGAHAENLTWYPIGHSRYQASRAVR